MEKKKERIAIFIDGRNFYHSTKRLERKGVKINIELYYRKDSGLPKLSALKMDDD